MKANEIRPIAICVFRQGDRILVAVGHDSVKHESFYRPIGGAIKFGEMGAETLTRELREELDAEISNLRYLGALENVFTYNGMQGHEIVLVYDGTFSDPSFYHSEELMGREDDGTTFTAVWKSITELRSGSPLYPTGLMQLLENFTNRR